MKKSYSELLSLASMNERFEYLKLHGTVGSETFGTSRRINQQFYSSDLWKCVRNKIILRDKACNLGIEGQEIKHRLQVHHINPIRIEDIIQWNEDVLLNPENLICVSATTHNAIHYGNNDASVLLPVIRSPGDTCLWRYS